MESVETFMEIFTRSWEDNNNDNLTRILKDVSGYLQNISKSDSERALEIILNEQEGLIKFIDYVLRMPKHQIINFNTSLKEAFNALKFIMEFFKEEYESYVIHTQDICFCCIKARCWFYARKTAAEALKKLMELFNNYDLQLEQIIDYYNDSYLKLYKTKDGCVFYIVLGAIARYCPKTENMVKSVDSIFLQLLKDLKLQYKPTTEKQPEEVKIYLECILDILVNFVPFEENSRKSIHYEKLYSQLSILCEPNKGQKIVRHKAISVLSTHMKHFSSFICKDYKKWHALFNQYLEDTQDYNIISALRAFYKIMAAHLFKEDDQDVFLYFKSYFILNLCKKDLPKYKLRLIIYGLGEFSASYVKYLNTEIYEMFQMIASRTLPFYAKDNKVDNDFEALTDYLRALSQILRQMPNVSLHQLNIITELSIQFTKRFPEIKVTNKNYAASTLKVTFINISYLEKTLQREYFNTFFREGILWSCSHTLFVDVELQQEIQHLREQPICYKNYLPLWHSLFSIDNHQEFSRFLMLQIFNEFVTVLITFIDKLNLNVTAQENALFNTYFSLKAENETDFRFFINLVDLYVEIFEKSESVLFQNRTEKLLIYFIKYSYKYPLISGFYKLIEVIFKKPDVFIDYQNYFSNSTCELISQYLLDVVKLLCGFSDELQLSCIYLIFNAPLFFIEHSISQMTPVFKIAFKIGLTDLSLAFCALDTVENWIENTDNQCSIDFLKNIIFYIDPYLSSEESLVDVFQGIVKKKRSNIKSKTVLNVNESLEALQKRILLFYGSLSSNVLFDFVHEKSVHTNASWNKKNILQCELLFPDLRLELHFDKFIPRIIELTNSGDRKTKISACELLHTMITVILGKNLMDQCFNKNLCYAVLRLGCDPDDTVRNLYHPLVIQLTHYLSSKLMKELRTPQDFVNSLFEGLTEEFNSSLRDYCGLYLKEFVQWSIKQSTESDMTKLSDVRAIIRRITNLALYPSNKKRVAAAIAFNYLYTILRENTNVINIYWLEFLYAFVKSMEECDSIQIVNALNHIEKVIIVKSNLFNAKSSHRRKPPGFSDETLSGTLMWLFNYCGSVNTNCRRKCIELFENLLPHASNSASITDLLVKKVNEIALKNLEENFECVTINRAKAFLKSLDFYIWIFKTKFLILEPHLILKNSPEDRDYFSKCFTKFVSIIVNKNEQNFSTNTSMEAEELINLTSEITLKILEFISVLLEKEDDMMNLLWNDNLFLLITRCTLYPQEVGLTAKKLHIIEKLSDQLECLLTLIVKGIPKVYLMRLQETCLTEAMENFICFAEIHDIIDLEKDINVLSQFLEGLFILKKTKFVDFEKEHNFTVTYLTEKISTIFNSLKTEIMDNDSCKKLNEHVKDYLTQLMKFFLVDYQLEIVKFLVNLIINDSPLVNLNNSKIAHGEYFLGIFKEPLLQYLLKNPVETMKIFDEFLIELPDKILFLIEELLIFAQNNKTTESEVLAGVIIDRCNNFQRVLNKIEIREAKFFNINRIAITLKKKPTEAIKNNGSPNELYTWILEELLRAKDLEKKTMILRNFLICLVDEESTEISFQVSLVFQNLRDTGDTVAWQQKLESDEVQRFQAGTCFQVLLKMLIVTKSVIVYESIIKFTAGVYKYIFKEDIQDLSPYFASISNINALKSLQVAYKIFMDMNLSEERLDVLRHFLLPSMELSKPSVIENFYEENCQELATNIIQKIDDSMSNSLDRQKLIISKIGSYNMFELMFAKFELKFLNIKDPVSKTEKAINQILVQQTLNVRCFSAKSEEEKEVTRLLHCAALNCCISVVSLKEEEKFYKYIFLEDRKKDQLIWERIVDCEKQFNLTQTSSTIRKDRKKLINIRSTIKNQQNPDDPISSYFHRYNLVSLTLLEDVHAYDLNDTRVLAQPKVNAEEDRRLDLSFENDELNNHECMPMISGVLIHMFNNEISLLPDDNQKIDSNNLPDCFKYIRNSFATQKDNAKLFLMKIICNTKNVFLPLMKAFFKVIVSSCCQYLEKNSLNYIIRDILVIIIESKYELQEEVEKLVAQKLIESLIERAIDPITTVHKYNFELIESLCKMWGSQLKCPENLNEKIDSDPDLAIRIIVILQRCNLHPDLMKQENVRILIRNLVEQWKDNASLVLIRFEALGWLLRSHDEDNCRIELVGILNLLEKMEKQSRDRCAQCICAVYRACRSVAKCKDLFKYASPRCVSDNHKPECLELFLERVPQLDPLAMTTELLMLDLKKVLQERVLGCESPALRIIEKVVPLLPESELKAYVDLVIVYTGPTSLLEYRRLAYSILMEVYTRYVPPHPLGALCARKLIQGLAEPAEELQELVLSFWRDRVQLPETSCERLLTLLAMYTPELHDDFSRFVCLLMLELTSKSFDDKRVMFNPLTECSFRDYEILVSRRRMNLGSMAPLFAPSLASQLSQLSQVPTQRSTFAMTQRLLATRELEFEPTAQFLAPQNPSSQVRKIPDPSQNKLSKRLITKASDLSDMYSQEAIRKQSEYQEKLKREAERRRNSAKIYRKYRIGDFPDVEITHASFVVSIRQCVMKDWLFCKDFVVMLVCKLIDRMKGNQKYDSFVASVSEVLKQILQTQGERNNFAPAVLEIILYSKVADFDGNSIRKICKTMGLHSLGILLLEEECMETENMVDDPPPAKKMKLIRLDKENWIEMANLYKSIGEIDIVNSIFKRQDLFSPDLRESALAHTENKWSKAKNSYELAYEVAIGPEKEHCLEGMFECLSELSSWGEINRKIEIILNGDYDSVWENPKRNQLLPWIFKAQLQKALEDFTANKDPENASFFKNFDTWIQKRQNEMKRMYGEEMSVLYLCGDETEDSSRHCLKLCLDHIREQWIRINPLSEKMRDEILLKLRGMHNISVFIKTIKSPDIEEGARHLIQYWDQHLPTLSDDLLSWNMQVYYRLMFVHRLHEKLQPISEDSSILNDLITASVRQRMHISELAMKYKNNIVAKKHTIRIEKILSELNNDDFSKLKYDFKLTASKYKFVCGQIESSLKKKFNYYVNSWEIADNIIMDDAANLSTKINVQYHVFDLIVALKSLAQENPEFLNLIMNNEFVVQNLDINESQEIFEALTSYSFNCLKNVCEEGSAKEMAESYTKFGKYCYSLLHGEYNNNPSLSNEFISSILTGMSLGSLEAAHYFPCLLKCKYYESNEQAVQLFNDKSENVPSWLFLSWQAQIMSYLGKSLAQLLIPIVERLIKDYPNGVMYNFRQTYDALPELRTNPKICSMYESLFSDSRIDTFFKAMHRVCQPEHYLRHLLQVLDADENFTKGIDDVLNKVFSNQQDRESSLQGPLYKILDKYRIDLENLKNMNYDTARENLNKISIDLYSGMKKRLSNIKKQALQLKDYSSYLSNFSGDDFVIEIPGQYSGNRKPMPQYHVKISKFDRFVAVMESKCNPIKINMIGNDANTYGYLVKFGEDLRQDQRLQQIFNIANKTLDTDTKCKQRHLIINTYHVVPLSTSLGLIEWVDETKSLKEFVEFSISDKELIRAVSNMYQRWIEKAGQSTSKNDIYKEALLKYSSKDVVLKMKEFINYFEWDCLRKTFVMLSPSLESFVSLRQNFVTSYATMCIVHWITGVGDRHLENMLIKVETGKCYGIDFGSAFGAGIDQSVPELVPFRLTAQILGLMRPFDEQALFGVTMSHVLSALRKDRDTLLACLDVFIHEPLNWSANLKKRLQDENKQHTDIKWLPKRKIAFVEKKLNGTNPSTIMLEELSDIFDENDNDKNKYFSKYEQFINGTDSPQTLIRSRMKNESLTPEEQVQCLLDQAKDLNLLGRMWVGWSPFV